MRKAAIALAVIGLTLYAPMTLNAQCCVGKPYPGLGPPEEPMCYEGLKIFSPITGETIGCLGYDGGNCLFCEAVIQVGVGV